MDEHGLQVRLPCGYFPSHLEDLKEVVCHLEEKMQKGGTVLPLWDDLEGGGWDFEFCLSVFRCPTFFGLQFYRLHVVSRSSISCDHAICLDVLRC